MMLAIADLWDNAIRAWGARFDWPAEYALRLVIAVLAGGLVGIEREIRGRQAGFRTNILVAVGSCLVMIVSISFAERRWVRANDDFVLSIEPARIAYGIMTGIGFLGAGTIVKHRSSVRGLTTAAGLWCVAGVGMAAGFGMYTLTLIATAIIVASLWILDYFEGIIPKMHYRTVVIRRPWGPGCVTDTLDRMRGAGLKVMDMSFQRTEDLRDADFSVRVAFMNRKKYYALERQLEGDAVYQLMATRED